MLENLVVELVGKPIGKRWIERFCKRHADQLTSIYLRNIDQARHITDNSRHFQHYFNLISIPIGLIFIQADQNADSLIIILKNIILNLRILITLIRKASY